MTVTSIPFRLVDVFTDRALAGNQLCVCPDGPELDAIQMQAIAAEIRFSETTFVTGIEHDRYAMRIFTPGRELPFAGHPTLGTAFVLASEGRIEANATQVTKAGEVPVELDVAGGMGWMQQLPPVFEAEANPADAAAAASLPAEAMAASTPVVVSTGVGHLMAQALDDDAVAAARPGNPRLADVMAATSSGGLYLFAFDPQARTVHARLFSSGFGIDEDPATGSAAGPLGAYLVERLGAEPGRFTIRQGIEMGRPSTILVDVERNPEGGVSVRVGGGVVIVGRGQFELDLS
jgi:trans-2,3-dihydro-3-hydroxyanthranilate isomerase